MKYSRNCCYIAAALLAHLASAQAPGTGRIEIKTVRSYSGREPLSKPTAIIVYNFSAGPEQVQLNKSAVNRVRTRVSGAREEDKVKLAHKIVDDFSASLIQDLRKTGLPVSQGIAGELPPDNALAIQGDFLSIDEGNRARRMAVGLGAGASKVVAHVECYLKRPTKQLTIAEFKATSQSSRKPGAAETMGAGAAPEVATAVSGAIEMKQGAEGDANRMAKALAKQIAKTMTAQGWIDSKTR